MKALHSIVAATVLATPLAASAETTVLFNNFLPPPDVTNRNVVQPWLESIATATDGNVMIEQPSASLAPPNELLNTVQQGIADAGFVMVGFLENSNPLLQLTLLPGINTNAEDSSVALWRTYQEHFAEADQLDDVKLLGLITVTPGHIYAMGDAPIEAVGDMANLKTWGLPGVSSRALSSLGAVVTPGPAVRMYEVISGGVVNAFCCVNYPALEAFNVTQFMNSATEIPGGLFAPTFAFFIRQDIWDSLPPEDQEAITNVSGETMARLAAGIDTEYAEARQRFIDSGGQVLEASDSFVADANAAWEPLRAEWIENADAAGIDGTAALAFYREQLEQLAQE
ncbi:TRAP transporter substrate-binding protein DctP [Paracoccus albus]|uniref:TRAP transporter substrate-binding protein DctP n=1 Tax=Paracoccus albus TaxID=3017784 RepID=UPI0022F07241|nr:TRAP transporter substrate-binding protein DctP [Paracoccus albus]WBU59279.1 TRAP transporter substrate-binding protein DctP [Paracoccus albus]